MAFQGGEDIGRPWFRTDAAPLGCLRDGAIPLQFEFAFPASPGIPDGPVLRLPHVFPSVRMGPPRIAKDLRPRKMNGLAQRSQYFQM